MDAVSAAVMRGILVGLKRSGAVDAQQLNEVFSAIEMEGAAVGHEGREQSRGFVTSVVLAADLDPR